MFMLESVIEKHLVKQCRSQRLLCLKFKSPGNSGVTDRVIIGHGRIVFVETKRPGDSLRPLQIEVVTEMRQHMADVRVIDTIEGVTALVAELAPDDSHPAKNRGLRGLLRRLFAKAVPITPTKQLDDLATLAANLDLSMQLRDTAKAERSRTRRVLVSRPPSGLHPGLTHTAEDSPTAETKVVVTGDDSLESVVEKYLLTQCKRQQFLCYKFRSPTNNGVPDRLIIGHGKVVFVELKRPGETLDPLQVEVIAEMRAYSADVRVIDTLEDIDALLAELNPGHGSAIESPYIEHRLRQQLVDALPNCTQRQIDELMTLASNLGHEIRQAPPAKAERRAARRPLATRPPTS
ncbi:hypothetical protein ANMWB30_24510 [Arthrobacter sp. MWB30]|nr:hypothetical protein ANMWB30_24510 [Arthrobacter sp. MWB30]